MRGLCVDSFCDSPLYSLLPLNHYAYSQYPFNGISDDGPYFCAAEDGNVGICMPGGGSECADLANDPANCGGWGYNGFACPAGQTCERGVCSGASPECGIGQLGRYCNLDAGWTYQCCSGGCTDTNTDGNNCGYCGNACAPGQSCVAGVCQ